MSTSDIDTYLADLDEPERSTLEQVRRCILAVVPDAEQCLAYDAPAFRVDGTTVAGFAAHAHHLSHLPHSGTVLTQLADDVAGYETSRGALRFPVDAPLPASLVERLVTARIQEL